MLSLASLYPDRWSQIVKLIERGEHPRKRHIIAALRRGEAEVPAVAQLYLAALLNGQIDKRGRPETPPFIKLIRAEALIFRVDRWARVQRLRYRRTDPITAALACIAAERGWKNIDVARRNYERAISVLRADPAGQATLRYREQQLGQQ